MEQCKQLEHEYEQAIERKDMARELAKAYEQDILAMDMEYKQAIQMRDMEQEVNTSNVQVQDYEQDMLGTSTTRCTSSAAPTSTRRC